MSTQGTALTVHLPMPTTPLLRQTAVGCLPLSPISRLSSLGSNASTESEETIDLARSHLIALLQHLRRQDMRIVKKIGQTKNQQEIEILRQKKDQIAYRLKKTMELLEIL